MDINVCPNCGETIPSDDDYCGNCGIHRIVAKENMCVNPSCERNGEIVNPERMYCGACGKPTKIGNQILKMI